MKFHYAENKNEVQAEAALSTSVQSHDYAERKNLIIKICAKILLTVVISIEFSCLRTILIRGNQTEFQGN